MAFTIDEVTRIEVLVRQYYNNEIRFYTLDKTLKFYCRATKDVAFARNQKRLKIECFDFKYSINHYFLTYFLTVLTERTGEGYTIKLDFTDKRVLPGSGRNKLGIMSFEFTVEIERVIDAK